SRAWQVWEKARIGSARECIVKAGGQKLRQAQGAPYRRPARCLERHAWLLGACV
ncbi:hypothetical protein HAX54_006465, partial [Datura stramonium]|nr:hypothetical protein [Datura stramonium]